MYLLKYFMQLTLLLLINY